MFLLMKTIINNNDIICPILTNLFIATVFSKPERKKYND